MSRVLLAWIGFSDLRAVADPKNGVGPIADAVRSRAFDHLLLLRDGPRKEADEYKAWLRAFTSAPIEIRFVTLVSPTNYEDIHEKARAAVTAAREKHGADARLSFHLSPGTPAMAVIWILIGTTENAELLQSSKEQGLETVKVPFQIAAEFIPAIVHRTDAELERLAGGLRPDDASFEDLHHQSAAMKALIARARLAAVYTAPVLIEGESGTGKEMLARAIHRASDRKGDLVAVNCGAIPPELMESEFFGHKKGSFTGAFAERKGHFEQANKGTLFLDEIGELPLAMQVKLLRAIQEKKVVRVGESAAVDLDVRIISATNRDLALEVGKGRFREDLYYRLNVLALQMPPLRERKGDVSLLAERLFDRQQEQLGKTTTRKKLSPGAKNVLLRHGWPGNVRELEAALLRALVWSTSATISEAEMRSAMATRVAGALANAQRTAFDQPIGEGFDVQSVRRDVARHYIERALEESSGNKTQAAKLIGLKSQQSLTNWARRNGVKT